MQAAPRHSASPRVEAIAAWLIAALILAGGGIVARLIVDYPRLLPNSYIGFLIYRAGPTIALLWACAGAAIAINEQRFAGSIVNVVSADEYGHVAEGNIGEFLKFVPGLATDTGGGPPAWPPGAPCC